MLGATIKLNFIEKANSFSFMTLDVSYNIWGHFISYVLPCTKFNILKEDKDSCEITWYIRECLIGVWKNLLPRWLSPTIDGFVGAANWQEATTSLFSMWLP